jgi:LysM repeat protein
MRKLMIVGLVVMMSGVLSAKVLGKINGYPIIERDANAFLKVVTKGKLKYHQLRPKDKVDVVKRISVDSLLIGMAKKHLGRKELNQVIVNYWLAKKIRNVTVKPEAVKKAYRENKKFFKDPQGGGVLPFEKVKEMIEVSLKQKKYVAQLMEKAKITMGKKVIQAPKKSRKKKSSSKSAPKNSTYKGKTTIYVVKSGNTLSGIAHKHHIATKVLRKMNGMTEKDTLKIGQKLQVPKK